MKWRNNVYCLCRRSQLCLLFFVSSGGTSFITLHRLYAGFNFACFAVWTKLVGFYVL